ncbi:MAG: exodeoxyribonuclease VII large subunit [Planctomycetes bacterium]|nr:exodeoxyribonuclease VII large subunit [Planctomycetota bacterium]
MSGTIELDRDGKTLVIGFPYREDLVEEVRALPSRRFDRGSKTWRVPIAHAELVVATFMKHGFEVSGDVSGVLAGTGGAPAPAAEPVADAEPDTSAGMTISQLNERARAALRSAFPKRVKVVGEVVDFEKTRGRSHLFFRLVEKSGERMAATVDVALFERTAKQILPTIEKRGLTLRDGIEIMVEAKVDLYPANGRFQLIIEDIHPEFTLGKLALSREQILAELRKAGLAERNKLLPWPRPALRIGVLASPTSDGWNDFLREIESSRIGFDISLFPVKVQGDELESTMLEGLEWFAEHAAHFDALCIIRGGGSRTDLAWFDNRSIAFAVAEHPLKVLCGIGHERDVSVLDEISSSMKTPTATAAFLVHEIRATGEELRATTRRLADLTRERIATERELLAETGAGLRRAVHGRMVREHAMLGAAASRLATATGHRIERERRSLDDAFRRAVRAVRVRLDRERARIDTADTRRRLLDPTAVVRRGYTIVRDASGKIVTDVSALKTGDTIDVAFRDGRARSRVEQVHRDTEKES